MSTISQRRQRVKEFLDQLDVVRRLVRTRLGEKLFELECYFQTATRLTVRNKRPEAQQLDRGVFRPLLNPGRLGNGSYLTFTDNHPSAEILELFLNSQVNARTQVMHSPDILLTVGSNREPVSVYECKKYSGSLGLSVYREFIGLLIELQLVRINVRTPRLVDRAFPELSPRIFTTARKSPIHTPLEETYGFSVEDGMP